MSNFIVYIYDHRTEAIHDYMYLFCCDREALAHETILNMPERVDWRNCKSSKEEESQMTQKFREDFSKYDPNCMW